MPTLLITEPGSPDANSFASYEEFLVYSSTRFPVISWVATATQEDIERRMIQATRLLQSSFDWTGGATYEDQALISPRIGWLNRNAKPIPSDVIPQELKDAESELTLQLGVVDLLSNNEAADKGIRKVKAGSVEVEFQSVTSSVEVMDALLTRSGSDFYYMRVPDAVRLLLVPQWYRAADLSKSSGGVEFMFGVLSTDTGER